VVWMGRLVSGGRRREAVEVRRDFSDTQSTITQGEPHHARRRPSRRLFAGGLSAIRPMGIRHSPGTTDWWAVARL